MTPAHVQAIEDRAVGEAIRRLQREAHHGAAIYLQPSRRVTVIVTLADGQARSHAGTDLEDCCDAAIASIRALDGA